MWEWQKGFLTSLAFVVGSVTSMFCGFLGMKVAVFSNARTTIMCAQLEDPYMHGFNTSFRAGAVMGFGLVRLVYCVVCVCCKTNPRKSN
jgi:inorganic pyrophosphatase